MTTSSANKPPLSKRGRKHKQIVFTKESVPENTSVLTEKIILKLPITLERINFLNNEKKTDSYQAPTVEIREPTITKKTYKYKGCAKQGDAQIETIVYDCINILPVEISNERSDSLASGIKTDICCFWCTYQFDTHPVCMPESYDGKRDIFKVFGCFCSFNCALSFSMKHRRFGHQELVSNMHKKLTGEFMTIKKAPDPYCLKKFGGPISIEDYRQTFRTGRDITINVFPMIFMPWQIEDSSSSEMLKTRVTEFNKENEEPVINFPKKRSLEKKQEKPDSDSVLFRLACK